MIVLIILANKPESLPSSDKHSSPYPSLAPGHLLPRGPKLIIAEEKHAIQAITNYPLLTAAHSKV